MCPVGASTSHTSNTSWESEQLSHDLLLPAGGATSFPHWVVLLMYPRDLGHMLQVGRGPTAAPGQGLPQSAGQPERGSSESLAPTSLSGLLPQWWESLFRLVTLVTISLLVRGWDRQGLSSEA